MIVDTSALVATARKEAEFERLLDAMADAPCFIPAPVLVEFHRVTSLKGNRRDPDAVALIAFLVSETTSVETFRSEDAELASAANEAFGTGNHRGGRLNMLDLMVYAVAKRMNLPILCTGRDFASTDAFIHPASRPW